MKFAFLIFVAILAGVEGSTKCVHATGIMQCDKNSAKHNNVKIELIDRDGIGIFQYFDPDDLMMISRSRQDGTFELNGCASDPDLPFELYENLPDPYIVITHYCNNEFGERLQLAEFRTFQPDSFDAGYIDLDNGRRYKDASWIMDKINRKNGVL